jgi:hypothetical protein
VAPVESLTLVKPTSVAWEELALVMLGASGASLGAVSIEVDGAGPRLGEDIGGLLLDLVRRGTSIGVP